MLKRLYERFFTPKGAETQPITVLFLVCCHHCGTIVFTIPWNLYYPEEPLYLELCLVLSTVTAVVFLARQYSSMLDIYERPELAQMFYWCVIIFVFTIWFRIIHYHWLAYRILMLFQELGHSMSYNVGMVCIISMDIQNFINAHDSIKRLRKFSAMYFMESLDDQDKSVGKNQIFASRNKMD